MNIYCIGIGGIGLSSVARIAHAKGNTVSGADNADSPLLKELEEEGLHVYKTHEANQVKDAELVLISQAVPYSAPADYLEALSRGIPMMSWQEYLGAMTKDMEVIAICGTHGKSTTTGMVTKLLLEMGEDPTVMVGTKMKELDGKNFRVGKGKYAIIEADEYHENFLHYHPNLVLLTSLEPDHLDYYKTKENYEKAFEAFFEKVQSVDGVVFVPAIEQDGVRVAMNVDHLHVEMTETPYAGPLGVFGEHNRWNASLVVALGKYLQCGEDTIEKALSEFTGTWRRMELRGHMSTGALVYDDYGHHPKEVQVTLAAFRAHYPEKKLLCIFQPHQYSRSYQLLEEFGTAFSAADVVIIPEIYESRDTAEDKARMCPERFVQEIQKHHPTVFYGKGLESTLEMVISHPEWCDTQSIIVCMGAGTITNLAGWLVK